jgi:hypothetical protein
MDLEAEIDKKLLVLEDVKTQINEILHKKLYNYDIEPELELTIRDAEVRKLKQEKDEKELLQHKDDCLNEMMDLEDKEEALKEVER